MSKNYAEIVKAIRAQAKVFEAVIDLSNELDELGSLKNASSEAAARLGALRDEEAGLAESITKLKDEIKALTGKKSDASVRAQNLLEQAERDAAGMIADAKLDIKRLLDAAKAQADGVIADAEKKASDVAVQTSAAQGVLDAINAEIAEKKQESTALQKAIEAIKKKFS